MNQKQRKLKAAKRKHHNTKKYTFKVGQYVKLLEGAWMPHKGNVGDKAVVLFACKYNVLLGNKDWDGHDGNQEEDDMTEALADPKLKALLDGCNAWYFPIQNNPVFKKAQKV